ncbi:hypothetical protein [Tenacibaculum sp. 190524A02b]|uniref:hypothetical protein n=1 Tax=Tenacibaculum vairaonense TaxID=3137860 RepID=UPI0032B1524D
MKQFFKKTLFVILFSSTALITAWTIINSIGDDFYGRLIQTKSINKTKKERPNCTLILKKILEDESAIEASIVLNYEKALIFEKYESTEIDFDIVISDRYNFNPSGLTYKYRINDNINKQTFGYTNSGFETDNFKIPFAPSAYGYPYDEFKFSTNISLFANGITTNFNYYIQDRIPGRIINTEKKQTVNLSRTKTEKTLVLVSSIIFILMSIILTYKLVTKPKGLKTIEELIMVASYIIAIAGFREILGLSRYFGTGFLEITVIFIPLISLTIGLIYSYFKGKTKTTANN